MTESEWLSCTNLDFMLERARSDRKRMLFGVACCRRIWHLFPDENCRQAVVLAEQMAQGYVSTARRKAALELVRQAAREGDDRTTRQAISAADALLKEELYASAALYSAAAAAAALRPSNLQEEQGAQAALLRDILGYPFATVRIDPAWRAWNKGTVVALAQTIYDEDTFDQAPVLADALEEAGCTDARILDHLRGPGPHVRGCWVVDLILEKI
jgi:hypothetical protein